MLSKGRSLMDKKMITIILSFGAAICFYIASILRKDTLSFILGCAWVCIAISNIVSKKNLKK